MNTNKDKQQKLIDIYHKYVNLAMNITDISQWVTKKSVSKAVLNPARLNEQKVLDAISHLNPREGDKFYLYYKIEGEKQAMKKGEPVFYKDGRPKMEPNKVLKDISDWNNEYAVPHYVGRVYDTLMIFENLLDKSEIIKYTDSKKEKLKNLDKLEN